VGQQFNKLIDVSVVFSMVSYAYSAIALCRLRPLGQPGARKDWAIAGIALVFSVWVIVASDVSLLLIAAIIMATSVPLYPFYRGKVGQRLDLGASTPVAMEAE
jgi:amino acid transporter